MPSLLNPLFSLERGGFEEITVSGEIYISQGGSEDTLFAIGKSVGFPARSLLKPFQFIATDLKLEPKFFPSLGSISRHPRANSPN